MNTSLNIQKATAEILESGLTQQELADLVPCSQPAINAFLKGTRGQRPSFEIAKRLLDIHRERCRKKKSVAKNRRSTDKETTR